MNREKGRERETMTRDEDMYQDKEILAKVEAQRGREAGRQRSRAVGGERLTRKTEAERQDSPGAQRQRGTKAQRQGKTKAQRQKTTEKKNGIAFHRTRYTMAQHVYNTRTAKKKL
jgi:hypothetical protein